MKNTNATLTNIGRRESINSNLIRRVETTIGLPGSIVSHGVSGPIILKSHLCVDEMNDSPDKPDPISDHYATHWKIDRLNSFFGAIVGIELSKTWKYNIATRWTKFMLVIGTAVAVYSNLLVISEPTKLIQVFSLFAVIAPVSVICSD